MVGDAPNLPAGVCKRLTIDLPCRDKAGDELSDSFEFVGGERSEPIGRWQPSGHRTRTVG